MYEFTIHKEVYATYRVERDFLEETIRVYGYDWDIDNMTIEELDTLYSFIDTGEFENIEAEILKDGVVSFTRSI